MGPCTKRYRPRWFYRSSKERSSKSISSSSFAFSSFGFISQILFIHHFNKRHVEYPTAVLKAGGAASIQELATIFYEEASDEGIKAEVAWTQAMLETNFLQYGGDVKVSQYNFAGLGATGGGVAGEKFDNVRQGIRAQIQHLKAYANSEITQEN